jgi:hypothetical protein
MHKHRADIAVPAAITMDSAIGLLFEDQSGQACLKHLQ